MQHVLHQEHLVDVAEAHVHVIIVGVLASQYYHIGVGVSAKVFNQPEIIQLDDINLAPINLVGITYLTHRDKVTP